MREAAWESVYPRFTKSQIAARFLSQNSLLRRGLPPVELGYFLAVIFTEKPLGDYVLGCPDKPAP